jgi:D-proline reductase (dithiol) PrdB
VGLVCRVVEAAGIPTVCVSTGRDLTALVKPPRSLFVNHPMGNPFGRPDDKEAQLAVLRAALRLVAECDEPGALVDYATDWGEPFEVVFKEKPADYQLKK